MEEAEAEREKAQDWQAAKRDKEGGGGAMRGGGLVSSSTKLKTEIM